MGSLARQVLRVVCSGAGLPVTGRLSPRAAPGAQVTGCSARDLGRLPRLPQGEEQWCQLLGAWGCPLGLSLPWGQGRSGFLGALGSGTQMRGGDQLSHSLVVVVVSGEERGGVGWGVSTVIPVSVHLSVS